MPAGVRAVARSVGRASLIVLLSAALVTPAPAAAAATSVTFSSAPGPSNVAATPFDSQPVVHVEDAGSPAVGALVTLSIAQPGVDGGLACTGGLTRATDAAGNARFDGCLMTVARDGYVLRATVDGLQSQVAGFDGTTHKDSEVHRNFTEDMRSGYGRLMPLPSA